MNISIDTNGLWYHGSDKIFDTLEKGSTITQWRELAEAFSHNPKILFYTKKGQIYHTGMKKGYLYIVDEPIILEEDLYPHPKTTMDKNVEFLTKRPIKVKLLKKL